MSCVACGGGSKIISSTGADEERATGRSLPYYRLCFDLACLSDPKLTPLP